MIATIKVVTDISFRVIKTYQTFVAVCLSRVWMCVSASRTQPKSNQHSVGGIWPHGSGWNQKTVSCTYQQSTSRITCLLLHRCLFPPVAYVLDTLRMSWLTPQQNWQLLCCWPPLAGYQREWRRSKSQFHSVTHLHKSVSNYLVMLCL